MDFKEIIDYVLIFMTILGFLTGYIKPEYQTIAWILGMVGFILFIFTTPTLNKVNTLEEKVDKLSEETKRLNEKLKIYEHLTNLDIRIKNIENKKR